MGYTADGIFEVLERNLSNESKFFLMALYREKTPLHKEQLRDIANELYRNSQSDKAAKPLVQSRHGLDIHTARLEGAGLVSVQEMGRVRIYSLSDLGNEFLTYISKRVTQENNNNK